MQAVSAAPQLGLHYAVHTPFNNAAATTFLEQARAERDSRTEECANRRRQQRRELKAATTAVSKAKVMLESLEIDEKVLVALIVLVPLCRSSAVCCLRNPIPRLQTKLGEARETVRKLDDLSRQMQALPAPNLAKNQLKVLLHTSAQPSRDG